MEHYVPKKIIYWDSLAIQANHPLYTQPIQASHNVKELGIGFMAVFDNYNDALELANQEPRADISIIEDIEVK